MMQGTFVHSLGRYLLVEMSGPKAKRIFFSHERPAETSKLAREIAAHLESGAPCPKAELELSACTDFQKQIYALVQEIPSGRTMTYGMVAERAGRPRSARAVGRAMAFNPFAILVPCHRVVAKGGLGGYLWGIELKEKLLRLERDRVRNNPAALAQSPG